MLINTQFTQKIDVSVTKWMSRYGILLLRISIGIVFLWFGFLKFFPGASPAEGIAVKTIETLTLGMLSQKVILILLAVWESLIGIGLITGFYIREVLLILFVQMIGTLTPIFLFPGEVFRTIPYAPTLEGQYIIKNLVLISAGIVIGATVRGGKIISDPEK